MELLRILAMIFIVSVHYVSANSVVTTYLDANEFIARIINSCTYCCVNIFVLISGWFYKPSREITISKPVEKATFLWLKTIFYSITIMLIYSAATKSFPSKNTLIESFIPITCKAYWFLSAYIVLLFVSPFLDRLINNISCREHGLAVILIVALVSIPSTFLPEKWLIDIQEGYSVLWFVCLYIIGSFLKRISDRIKISKHMLLIGYFIAVASFMAFFFTVKYLCLKIGTDDRSIRVFRYTSLPSLVSAVCLLLFFAKVNIKSDKATKFICAISSVTFDVYIIHGYELMGINLYSNLLNGKEYVSSPYMILHFVACVAIIYTGCTVVGLIRAKILDKPFKAVAHFAGEKAGLLENKILGKRREVFSPPRKSD